MKKLCFTLLLFTITLIGFSFDKTYAYVPTFDNTNEIQADSALMNIIDDDIGILMNNGEYSFMVQFSKPNISASYILFGDFVDGVSSNMYVTTYWGSVAWAYINGNPVVSLQDENWYLYIPQAPATLCTIYFHVEAESGAIAQAKLQDYIDNDLYLFYTVGTKSVVENAFLDRYTTLTEEEAFESGRIYGYNQARGDYYAPYFDEGYDTAVSDIENYGIEYADSTIDVEDTYDWGLGQTAGAAANEVELMNLGYIMQGFFRTFNILGIEVLPNITIGMIVGVQLLLGLMAFIIGVATFTVGAQSRKNRGGHR